MSKARVRYFQDTKGEWRWTLRAPNGEPIADSAEGYTHTGGTAWRDFNWSEATSLKCSSLRLGYTPRWAPCSG